MHSCEHYIVFFQCIAVNIIAILGVNVGLVMMGYAGPLSIAAILFGGLCAGKMLFDLGIKNKIYPFTFHKDQ